MTQSAPGFYATYADYKSYRTPVLAAKEIRRFDADIWLPAACAPEMSFLDVGCGTGAFLAYLAAKGVSTFTGIDHDPALAERIPEGVRNRFVCRDIGEALADPRLGNFDRVVALDVLEHFDKEGGLGLLAAIVGRLAPGGKIVVKVPNVASPWGLQHQFGDLTHKTAFTPLSLRQMAGAAGLAVVHVAPHCHGSRRRRLTEAMLHRALTWMLTTSPEIWTANFFAVLQRCR